MKVRTLARKQRGRGAVVGIAFVVAALVLGVAGFTLLHPHAAGGGRAAARLSGAPAPLSGVLALDLGPVTDQADVAACLTPDFAGDPAEVTVLYGVVQKGPSGSTPVLILRNTAGEIRLCDVFGGDYPSQLPLREATAARPVTFYSAGRRDWSCEQASRTLKRFTMTEWLSVTKAVDSVRLRFVVDGTPGPWFTTRASHGFAHLQAWLDGPLPKSRHLLLEEQVLDASGAPVAQDTVPARQKLPGCVSGSVQIG